jgi:uncharacterized membrane protein
MKTTDAAKILGLAGEITPETVRDAYRRAAMKYHPDRNPAGLEMMQAVNAAYEALKEFSGDVEQDASTYADDLNDALNSIIECAGLEIEVCGAWVWVSGDTKAHKDTLKAAGYRWAPKKLRWYYRPEDWAPMSRFARGRYSMEEIREKHGSVEVQTRARRSIEAA